MFVATKKNNPSANDYLQRVTQHFNALTPFKLLYTCTVYIHVLPITTYIADAAEFPIADATVLSVCCLQRLCNSDCVV